MGPKDFIACSSVVVFACLSPRAFADDTRMPAPAVVSGQQSEGKVASPGDTPEAPSRWSRYKNGIEGHFSPGGPYGLLGVSYDRSVTDWFGVAIGGGMGWTGAAGAVMGRLRWPFRTFAPFIEAGMSISPRESSGCGFSMDCARASTWSWKAAMWGHAGVGLEFRAKGHSRVRVYGGAAKILNESAGTCEGSCSGVPARDIVEVPYLGVAYGYGF